MHSFSFTDRYQTPDNANKVMMIYLASLHIMYALNRYMTMEDNIFFARSCFGLLFIWLLCIANFFSYINHIILFTIIISSYGFFLLFGTTGFSILGMGRASKFQATSEYESWNPKHEQVRDLRLFFQVRASSTPSINPKHERVCALAWYPKPKPDHLEMHRELSEHRVNIERALSDHQASIKRAHAQTHPYSIWSILFSNMSYSVLL